MKTSKVHIIPIILSLVLFVLTILLINRYVSKSSLKEAEFHNQILVDNLEATMDRECLIVERSVRSFLSGWFYYPQGDSVNYASSPLYIKDSTLPALKRDVTDKLLEFLKANNNRIASAMFIINPGKYEDLGSNYYIPYAYSGQDGVYRLDGAEFFDFGSFSQAELIMNMEGDTWLEPQADSPNQGWAVSYYIPLLCEDGSRFGAFGVSISLNYLQTLFRRFLPYPDGQSEIRVENESGHILESSNSYTGDENPHVFRKRLEQIPYDVVVLCSDKAIYGRAHRIINVVLLVTLVGLLLVSICTRIVYRTMVRQEKARVAAQSELKLAADVQQHILKSPNVDGPGYSLAAWLRPALEAGGDLYDYVQKPSGILFIIGDVSGKGMSAALFMSQVVSLFRYASSFSDDPARIVTRINSVLSQNNESCTFCTLIVGFCADATHLRLCNAGHNRPVLLHGGDASFMTLSSNIPVGVDDSVEYVDDTIEIAEGDAILLYTDGVTEAKNAESQLFGDERLLESSRNLSNFDPLIQDIHSFTNGEQQSDDITLLLCKSVPVK